MADTEARWYCVSAIGLPMLCASKEDAEREAARNDKVWPKGAPHRAAQLCDAAERDRLRAQLEVATDAMNAAVGTAQWQSRTNRELNKLIEERNALRADVRELVECLGGLDEAYCRAGPQLTKAERHEDRTRLMAARALLAKHNPLQALADNARELGLTYEDESKT